MIFYLHIILGRNKSDARGVDWHKKFLGDMRTHTSGKRFNMDMMTTNVKSRISKYQMISSSFSNYTSFFSISLQITTEMVRYNVTRGYCIWDSCISACFPQRYLPRKCTLLHLNSNMVQADKNKSWFFTGFASIVLICFLLWREIKRINQMWH